MPSNSTSREIQYLKDKIASLKRRLESSDLSDHNRRQLERELRRTEDDLAIQQMTEEACMINKEMSFLKSLVSYC